MKSTITTLLTLFVSINVFSQIIFEDSFETGNVNGQKPVGWYCGDTPKWLAGEGEQHHNRYAHTGNWYAYFSYNSNGWMFKEAALEADQTYEFSMWYMTDGFDGFQYEVMLGTDTLGSSMTQTIQPLTDINNTNYQQLKILFTANSSEIQYLGIHGISTNSPWYLCVDDVVLRHVEDYSFETNRITPDTIAYSGSYYDYIVFIANTGLNSDTYNLSSVSDWDVEFYDHTLSNQITSLEIEAQDTSYFSIRQYVPSQGVTFGQVHTATVTINSQNSSLQDELEIVTTAVTPIGNFPYFQGFDDITTFPLGWNTYRLIGNYAFELIAEGQYPDCTPMDGSAGMAFYRSFSSHAGNESTLVSPPLSFNDEEYIVRFWVFRTDNISNREDKFQIFLSDDEHLSNAVMLGEVHRAINFEPVETENGWFEYSYVFNPESSVKHIVFKAVSAYGWNMYLDNVKIVRNAPDEDPPQLISLSNTTQYAYLPMHVVAVVRDESPGTPTVEGIYNIEGDDVTFPLTLISDKRGDFKFEGEIPPQPDSTVGTLKLVMTDTYDNSATSEIYTIKWQGIAPLLEESFENEFPPEGWTIDGEPLTWCIWRQVGVDYYDDSDGNEYIVYPKHGKKQAGVAWDFYENHQDEWLITPPITITDSAYLTFETFAQYGSMWYDHYTVSVSTNGINWNTLWDAFYLNTYVNQYDEKVYLPLDDYIGQTIYIAWRAYNTLYDNFWYSWYIDDVRVEKRHHDTGDDGDDDDDDDDDGTGAPSLFGSSFDFEIVQNPVCNLLAFTINGIETGKYHLTIYDISGKPVQSERLDHSTPSGTVNTVNIANLGAGMYICRLEYNGEAIAKKFIVVR